MIIYLTYVLVVGFLLRGAGLNRANSRCRPLMVGYGI